VRQYFKIILIAACLGIICGIAENFVYLVLSIVPDKFGWKNALLPQIFLIAPLFNLLFFIAISLLVCVLCFAFPRIRKDLISYVLFGWLAIFCPLGALGKFHWVASVSLATGVVVLSFFLIRTRPIVKNIFLGYLLGCLIIVVVIMNILCFAVRGQKAHEITSNSAVDYQRPNVLLIVLDTLRADHLSSYRYLRKTTPNIDGLARDGVLFMNASATASWTLPSHASLMTGRYVFEHHASARPLDNRYPTLAEFLASNGYATAGFVANTFNCGTKTGLNRGFATYEDYFSNIYDMSFRTFYGKTLLERLPFFGYYDIVGRKRAADVNRRFLFWLQSHKNIPFFAFLNYLDVHDPHIAPSSYATRFSIHPNSGKMINSLLYSRDFTGGRKLTVQEVQTEIDGYDDSLAYLDAEIGSLCANLSALGVLDNTVLIITSDHGESFGNHGFYGHGNSLYRNLLHVPLIIRYPKKIPADLQVKDIVSLRAIPATIANILKLESKSPFPGISLTEYWAEKNQKVMSPSHSTFEFAESPRGIVPNAAYPLGRRSIMKSLTTSKWHLILYEEGKTELFRADTDTKESNNLAHTPEGKRTIKALGAKLEQLMPSEDWKIFAPLVDSHQ